MPGNSRIERLTREALGEPCDAMTKAIPYALTVGAFLVFAAFSYLTY